MKLSCYKILKILFCILLFSIGFGNLYIDIGFAVKPYMAVMIFIFITFIAMKKKKIRNLCLMEKNLLTFYIFICLSVIYSFDKDSTIRYILGFSLIMFFYFLIKETLIVLKIKDIEKIISIIGIIISFITIIYYGLGIIKSGFNFVGNGVRYYGLLLDRGIPRLTSLMSRDPNITSFYMTLFFFYYLYNNKEKRNKVGLILSSLIIILTFSRGAYISIGTGILISFFVNNKQGITKKIIKLITIILLIFILIMVLDKFSNINIVDIIMNRFDSVSEDGGSGRIILWKNAITTFNKNCLVGIGINSTLSYNLLHYGTKGYIHNTFLEVLSETGIIGMTIYVLFLIMLLKLLYSTYKKDNNTVFLVGTIVAMLIQMCFLSILLQEFFFFTVALIYAYNYNIIKQ